MDDGRLCASMSFAEMIEALCPCRLRLVPLCVLMVNFRRRRSRVLCMMQIAQSCVGNVLSLS